MLAPLPKEGVDACYVVIAGGIPACNTALLLQGVRRYGDRLRVVYQPQGEEPQELRVGDQVVAAFREAAAIEHLERLDFANAIPLLQGHGMQPGLLSLVEYAAQRYAFDFRSAQETLFRALRDGEPPVRDFIRQRLRHDLDPLLVGGDDRERLAALLRELYWNAEITYRHRRYADFLGRVYRFQEAVLRYLVEVIFDLATDLNPQVRRANQEQWEQHIEANQALLAYLKAQTIDERPLEWRRMGRPVYTALLRYATDSELGLDQKGKPLLPQGKCEHYSELLKRVNGLDGLVELRHRTIIGHDFEGVSEELIARHYKGGPKPGGARCSAVEGLAQIMGMLRVDVRDNPYEAVARFCTNQLRSH